MGTKRHKHPNPAYLEVYPSGLITVTFKVDDYIKLIDKIAGVRQSYFVE